MPDPFVQSLFFAFAAVVSGVYALYSVVTQRLVMPRYVHRRQEPVSYWLFIALCLGYGAACLNKAVAVMV